MSVRVRACVALAALICGTLVAAGAGTGAPSTSRSVLFGVNDILYGTFPSNGAQGMADNIIAGYQEIVDACRGARRDDLCSPANHD